MLIEQSMTYIGLLAIIAFVLLGVTAEEGFLTKKTLDASTLVEEYTLLTPDNQVVNVNVYKYGQSSGSHSLARRSLSSDNGNAPPGQASAPVTIDMTPASCRTKQCYPQGSFPRPEEADCDVVFIAQLYHSQGSLTAYANLFVYVWYKTCAIVFENPVPSSYAIQYNWAQLGMVTKRLAKRCFKPDEPSLGGFCRFDKYLTYDIPNVKVSIQGIVHTA